MSSRPASAADGAPDVAGGSGPPAGVSATGPLDGTPHPDVARLAAAFAESDAPTYDVLGVVRSRAAVENVVRLQSPKPDVPAVRDLLVPGADGRLPARVYDAAPGSPSPLVVYLHGGGFVFGGLRATDRPCRRLALAGACVVVAVDYRLAPETPFPGPLDDVVAAVRWIAANAADLGGDPERVVLLGDSAGGNLAAAAAIDLRETGGPRIAHQVLLYPCLVPPGSTDAPAGSMTTHADGPLMTRHELVWFWEHYLRSALDAEDPRAIPSLAPDHAGLPPATVVVAELDPLRDEGLAYAALLRGAGVPVDTTVYAGGAHGFWWMDAALSQAGALDAQLGALLRTL
ncbi:alpha/beta hydrolase [Patulibacter minatonensis]|uniref:alpha/beta hydrolase n=1 Tax=Patulibacter minatonensis TaxID=298163 RepID=UPI0006870829|nr:alpha/beta hydrolase [Patulibacter minatonensis]